jgi:hypothetical protein
MKKPCFLLLLACLIINAYGQSDTVLIRKHLQTLTKTREYRTFNDIVTLNQAARYIADVFSLYADTVYFQPYMVNGIEYKNVVASFGVQHTKTIIAGAHYDVCGEQEGADDNASGISGLLELARMLKGKKITQRITLVAYTLEEPPYFRTQYMGSSVHAASVVKENITGMVCLEMIGYFSNAKHSQDYPAGFLKLFYGSKGNYITLVKKPGAGKFVRKFKRAFKRAGFIRTKVFTGPASLPGIDFSDHQNYWKNNISALMITDTAFYRNKNYHEKTDTMETLDFGRMAKVIDSTLEALLSVAS